MNKKNQEASLELFATAPVPKAVLANGVPAMISMLMVLIYNIADTFFVGQTHNALMVASVSQATPVFLSFMGFGNIFGIGGTSVISRALGQGRQDYAKKVSAFCMWSCVVLGVLLSGLLLIFMKPILHLLGASTDIWDYTKDYLTIVAFAGPFSLVSHAFCNIVRTEGRPSIAMTGQIVGNLLNVILDPIFILWMDMGVAGAALATTISNAVSAVYYIVFLLGRKSILSINPKDFSMSDGIFSGVMAIGIPASLGNLLASAAQILAYSKLSSYHDDMALAGYGVSTKITMITGMMCVGFGQGVQPLLGYCIGAKNHKRFKASLKMAVVFAVSVSVLLTAVCYLLVRQIASAFLTEPNALGYAMRFARILLSTSFLFGLFYVLTGTLQSMGEARSALIINLSRQGFFYIPALLILNAAMGIVGLVWAQPIADVLSTALVIFLYLRTMRKFQWQQETEKL